MPRRHSTFRPGCAHWQLEPRVALSGGAPVPTAQLFHHSGIDGLSLRHGFLDILNYRVTGVSQPMTQIVSQAFTVFLQNYQALTPTPAAGTAGPALSGLVNTLTQEVDQALIVRQVVGKQYSMIHNRLVSPLAERALVPYANAQIAQLEAVLAAAPPVAGPNGTLRPADANAAVNTAYNAILNAIAEVTIHPLLFQQPGDFYISPDYHFTVNYTGAPATSSPGYFVRGPGGRVLPGAVLHAHFPA
jgi:hypothetical protein